MLPRESFVKSSLIIQSRKMYKIIVLKRDWPPVPYLGKEKNILSVSHSPLPK